MPSSLQLVPTASADDLRAAARSLHRDSNGTEQLGEEVAPKGLRLLHRVHRLPPEKAAAVANHFGELAKLQRATLDDLLAVDDIDETMARSIRETLIRVTESTIFDQYN